LQFFDHLDDVDHLPPLEFLPLVRGKEIKVIIMLKVITSGRRDG